MAENKVPQYSVRHVDGVMHLTLTTEAEKLGAEVLRVQQPQVIEELTV